MSRGTPDMPRSSDRGRSFPVRKSFGVLARIVVLLIAGVVVAGGRPLEDEVDRRGTDPPTTPVFVAGVLSTETIGTVTVTLSSSSSDEVGQTTVEVVPTATPVVVGARPEAVTVTRAAPTDPATTPAGVRVGNEECTPDEVDERYPGVVSPITPIQLQTLLVLGLVWLASLFGWNLVVIRTLLYPLKLLVTLTHESGHILAAACSGIRMGQVVIDPKQGGRTETSPDVVVVPGVVLAGGYAASIAVGGFLVFCAFDILASKLASFLVGLGLVVCLRWADGPLTKFLTCCHIGLLIGFWFVDHANPLRFCVLVVGVLNSSYVLYDYIDDRIHKKANPCDAFWFHDRYPRLSPRNWALVWIGVSMVVLTGWIVAALAVWRETRPSPFLSRDRHGKKS